ncbi:hypothetical protein X801_05689, partial [Opisthorchis viverrini]
MYKHLTYQVPLIHPDWGIQTPIISGARSNFGEAQLQSSKAGSTLRQTQRIKVIHMDCHYNDFASRIEDNRRENSYHHYQFKSAGQYFGKQTTSVFLPKTRLTPRVTVLNNLQKFDIRSSTDPSRLTYPDADFLAHVQILDKCIGYHP